MQPLLVRVVTAIKSMMGRAAQARGSYAAVDSWFGSTTARRAEMQGLPNLNPKSDSQMHTPYTA
jgi:hypothetical protein